MIFYFSGTGNTKYIAERLSQSINDRLIEITADLYSSGLNFDLGDDEKVGILSPVYWYGVPVEVMNFASKVKFNNYKNQYVYTLTTYGGSAGRFAEQLENILKNNGIILNAKMGVRMADNYIIGFNPPPMEKRIEYNTEAVRKLKEFIPKIEARESVDDLNRGGMRFISPVIRPLYEKTNRSKKFRTTSACTSCGKCARECPCNALAMVEGKPKWNEKCSQCLKCINCCPNRAIEYGKGTVKRDRYVFDLNTIKE